MDEIIRLLAEQNRLTAQQNALLTRIAADITAMRACGTSKTSHPLVQALFDAVGLMSFTAADLMARARVDANFASVLRVHGAGSPERLGKQLASACRRQPPNASRRLQRVKRSPAGVLWVIEDAANADHQHSAAFPTSIP
jgi:hypothetical protein